MTEDYYVDDQGVAGMAAHASVVDRGKFITRVYNHVFGSIIAFVLLEVWFFNTGIAYEVASVMLNGSWLLVLGAFIVVGWLARSAAHKAKSMSTQYLALGGYIIAEALIFIPMLVMADYYAPGAIRSAGLLTLIGFGGLTWIAFNSRHDFTFMGGLLKWIGVVVLIAIVGSLLFGFQLGTWFSVLMIGVAGISILRDTSAIIHHYPVDKHVAASLELFASVALMFWYLLRLFTARR